MKTELEKLRLENVRLRNRLALKDLERSLITPEEQIQCIKNYFDFLTHSEDDILDSASIHSLVLYERHLRGEYENKKNC